MLPLCALKLRSVKIKFLIFIRIATTLKSHFMTFVTMMLMNQILWNVDKLAHGHIIAPTSRLDGIESFVKIQRLDVFKIATSKLYTTLKMKLSVTNTKCQPHNFVILWEKLGDDRFTML